MDGDHLCHGAFAHRASSKARQYIGQHYYMPLTEILRGVGRELRATRGAVMALARFEWGEGKVMLANIVNVEIRMFGLKEPVELLVKRGVIGLNAPLPVVTEGLWTPGATMVIHSDGIVSHWQWEDFRHLDEELSSRMAMAMLDSLARDYDDATVVVVKWAGQRRA